MPEISPDDIEDIPAAAASAAIPPRDPGVAALAGARPGYGLQDALVSGLTFGLSDPVGAAGAAVGGGLAGAPGSFSERYQRALKQQQDAAAQYQTASPILSRVAPLVGMIAASPSAAPAAAQAASGLLRQLAQGLGFGAATGAAQAVPQATQEPTAGRALTDLGLGAGIGAAGTAALAPIGAVAGHGLPLAVRAAPAAVGSAVGEHFFPGLEGLAGGYVGEKMLGPLAHAAQPAAERAGRFLQSYLPGPNTRATVAIPAALIRYLMPGQPPGGVQPGQ